MIGRGIAVRIAIAALASHGSARVKFVNVIEPIPPSASVPAAAPTQ